HKFQLHNGDRVASLTRVGHTAHHLQVIENPDWILLVGGANLSSCCKNALLVNIKKDQVYSAEHPDALPVPGLSRYEQSSCICDCEIIIFGGATSEQPLNDILRLKMESFSLSGSQPFLKFSTPNESIITSPTCIITPRTQHTADCITSAGEIIIFAGGNMGSEPVADSSVYAYEVKSNKWRIIEMEIGDHDFPHCRMGHLMIIRPRDSQSSLNEEFVYIHGGMSGNEFLDDFHRLRIKRIMVENGEARLTGEWQNVRNAVPSEGSFWPVARAGHGGAIVYSNTNVLRFFIFGGLNSSGALNDLHYFDEGSKQWTTVTTSGNVVPSPRLDFAFTTLRLKVVNPDFTPEATELTSTFSVSNLDDDNDDYDAHEKNPSADQGNLFVWKNYLFIQGGMNADQDIFSDAFLCCLDDVP
ncbi:unnamed protein product, partial [Rodentolepis nana]|uniref:Rab9 effector protein with kelch motifs n=1 Tax=Rodentolepis nana TaxID=102285 RepID=A0A0R3T2B3_RODNA